MAEEAPQATPLQVAETVVERYLNGAPCSLNPHPPMTDLEKLIMLKMLRLEFPHQSTALSEIESAIWKHVRKANEAKK